jgi:alkylresorcinol/alkylpyrone synthase
MGFELTNAGLSIRLSQDIPPFVKNQIQPTLKEFLDACQVDASALQHFALHPGSIRIVEIIGRQMGLSPAQVAPTLNVLYNQGNMSSVTVLAVLQEIQTSLKPKNGDLGLMAAFGPGFVAETALFEWQENQ